MLYDDLTAVQSQAYGPEARGGATRSDVIISDTTINFPKVIQPNVLVCLTQEAYNKFYTIIRPGGPADNRQPLCEDPAQSRRQAKGIAHLQHGHGRTRQAHRIQHLHAGRPAGADGTWSGPNRVIKVIKTRIPEGFLELNQKALDMGLKLGQAYKTK